MFSVCFKLSVWRAEMDLMVLRDCSSSHQANTEHVRHVTRLVHETHVARVSPRVRKQDTHTHTHTHTHTYTH